MALHTLHAMAERRHLRPARRRLSPLCGRRHWTVPHFEKMLYDNALLARAYLRGCRLAARRAPGAGLPPDARLDAARDARPRGRLLRRARRRLRRVEGQFYVWTVAELRRALGDDADAAIAWLGATERGNFADPHHPEPGLNVLCARGPEPPAPQRERVRAALLALRATRTRPGLDDKRLASWNALAISALADAGAALGRGWLPGRRPRVRRVRAHRAARRSRAAAAQLLPTARFAGGIPRGPCVSAGSAARAVRSDLRGALVRAGARARRPDDRAVRRPAVGWLLHDRLRPRRADRAPQGRRGHADPLGQRQRRPGAAAPLPADRRAQDARRADSALALLDEIAPRHPSAFGHLLQAMHWRLAPARPIACAVPGAIGAPRGSTGSGPAPTR